MYFDILKLRDFIFHNLRVIKSQFHQASLQACKLLVVLAGFFTISLHAHPVSSCSLANIPIVNDLEEQLKARLLYSLLDGMKGC